MTQGECVPAFEAAVCAYTGSSYAVAVNSGTSALHLACRALDLGPGDILWTSPITFVASANCALYCGAEVDFVDIDSKTFNLSVELLADKLKAAEKNGRLPKIIVPVHLCGLSCNMEAIKELSTQYGFSIIEDACHAIGGSYKGAHIGSCEFSDITVFSFHPVKSITTGEGGMAVTNNDSLAEKMALLCSHGITRNKDKMTKEPDGPWYYQQVDLGYNYRMTDFQAALGKSQLKRLDGFVSRRNEIASYYDESISNFPVKPQLRPATCRSGMHLYVIRLQRDHLKKTYVQIFKELRAEGVGVSLHYIPVHTQPWYQEMGFKNGDFPNAENYYQEAISLPMYPDLKDEEAIEVVDKLRRGTGMKIAIIPARGGSKRIPGKNIRDFCGNPIIAYSIKKALESKLFDRVIVSTDDQKIASVAKEYGAEVPFMRPENLSDDHTGTNAVVKHAIQWYQDQGQAISMACCIYATAPFCCR